MARPRNPNRDKAKEVWLNNQDIKLKDLADQLGETVKKGLHEGQSIQTMSRVVQKDMDVSAGNANRIVRTESHRLIECLNMNLLNMPTKAA